MEGSMIFSQKNILDHSLTFFGEDEFAIKEMLTNNKGQSDIVTQKSNTEIKGIYANILTITI